MGVTDTSICQAIVTTDGTRAFNALKFSAVRPCTFRPVDRGFRTYRQHLKPACNFPRAATYCIHSPISTLLLGFLLSLRGKSPQQQLPWPPLSLDCHSLSLHVPPGVCCHDGAGSVRLHLLPGQPAVSAVGNAQSVHHHHHRPDSHCCHTAATAAGTTGTLC